MKNKILWITRTAACLALLIVLQMTTAPLGNKLVTGSLVNFMLIVSVMVCGLASGVTVAVISPVMASILGVGPHFALIPFIALGNVTLAVIWYFVSHFKTGLRHGEYAARVITAANSPAANCDDAVEPLVETGREAGDMPPLTPEGVPPPLRRGTSRPVIALIAGAAGKFLVLYISIVKIAVPYLLGFPEKQAAVVSATFSYPQLFHALIGGVLAFALIPTLKKAVRANN